MQVHYGRISNAVSRIEVQCFQEAQGCDVRDVAYGKEYGSPRFPFCQENTVDHLVQ